MHLIIGVILFSDNNNTKNIIESNIKKCKRSDYTIELMWVDFSDEGPGLKGDILYLPWSDFNTIRNRFLKYCLVYRGKWDHVLLSNTNFFLNIDRLISSGYTDYDRFGSFLWSYELIDFYFKSRRRYLPFHIDIINQYITNYFKSEIDINSVYKYTLKVKHVSLCNPSKFYLLSDTGKLNYVNMDGLTSEIMYDYCNFPQYLKVHDYIVNNSATNFYSLTIPQEIYPVNTLPHLYNGSYILLYNKADMGRPLYFNKVFSDDHGLLNVHSDTELYTPIFIDTLIHFTNIKDNSETKFYIYRLKDIENIQSRVLSPFDNIFIHLNDEVVLVSEDKKSYYKSKNGEYKWQLLSENDGKFSTKGIWVLAYVK
jgi:hypothetical protein